ncbi:hypothetical protein [Phenylobacterium sp.]|jgi:hypothetical protein|uniref:hypothetical protein n=1 Tax=Phenylobacterium sp. TaxID=1871053 RepID=UPI002E31477D|nr:hypothetical protein [Phenylobacterium sp.]HEX2560051.1 hypothetical protein [Phenylobacterium sp.]
MSEPRGLRPFNPSGYEILDGRLASHGELVIWSNRKPVPELGDEFTVAPRGALIDVAVADITLVDGGWVASCRLAGPAVATPPAKAST